MRRHANTSLCVDLRDAWGLDGWRRGLPGRPFRFWGWCNRFSGKIFLRKQIVYTFLRVLFVYHGEF